MDLSEKILKELDDYFNNTPKEEIDRHFKEIDDMFPKESKRDLEIQIKVAIWFAINDVIHQSGAREEKMWNESDPRDIELMKVLDLKTVELTNRIMDIIN